MFNLPDVEVGNLITNMSVSGFGVRRNAKVWYSSFAKVVSLKSIFFCESM